MNEENVTLVSKGYAESVFVTGPQVDQIIGEHSEFVTGPQLQTELSKKQDDVGLSLNNDQNVELSLRGFVQIGTPCENHFEEPVKFSSSIYDKNNNEITGGSPFNYISESRPSEQHSSLLLGQGPNYAIASSVFVCGPLYDKDGNEITGGGGGGSGRVTTDADGRTVILGRNGELTIGTDGELDGELGSPMIYASESEILYIGGVDNFINFYQNYTAFDGHVIRIKIGTEMLVLNQAKLQKLKQLLES